MKRIICILSFIIATAGLSASNPAEISFWGTIGISSPFFKLNEGNYSVGPGGSFGASYALFFNRHWGLGIGAEVAVLNSTVKADKLSLSYTAEAAAIPDPDSEINQFDFRATYDKYNETQTAFCLNFPITLQYRPVESGFTGAVGLIVSLPVKVSATVKATKLSTSGYFPYEGIEYTQLPQHGFGVFDNYSEKRNLNSKMNVNVTAEAGYRWKLNEKSALYTTVFAYYGITSIYTSYHDQPLLQYKPSGTLSQNSIWETQMMSSDRVVPLSIGIKIRYAFTIGR